MQHVPLNQLHQVLLLAAVRRIDAGAAEAVLKLLDGPGPGGGLRGLRWSGPRPRARVQRPPGAGQARVPVAGVAVEHALRDVPRQVAAVADERGRAQPRGKGRDGGQLRPAHAAAAGGRQGARRGKRARGRALAPLPGRFRGLAPVPGPLRGGRGGGREVQRAVGRARHRRRRAAAEGGGP